MNEVNVDVAVIGAGTAGLAAYRAAIAAGRSTVIIEGGPYGTTCARVGCMPSKLLIAAAEAAHATAKWDAFGLRLDGSVRIDGAAVMDRVRRERDRFVGFVLKGVDTIPADHRLLGHARFLDDHSLQVDDHTVVTFGRAVIATGSSPAIPPVLKGAGDRLIVNDDVFDWNDLPEYGAEEEGPAPTERPGKGKIGPAPLSYEEYMAALAAAEAPEEEEKAVPAPTTTIPTEWTDAEIDNI